MSPLLSSGPVRRGAFLLLVAACTPEDPVAIRPAAEETDPPEEPDEIEQIGGGEAAEEDERLLFADTGVLAFGIELSAEAEAQLAAAPTEYVEGAFVFRGERFAPVGVRLKGNSTYQWLDGRPAWKIKFDEYTAGARFRGLERLTLDSNYWDGSMMAETLAYRLWRLADAPAPRTGYARVSYNGQLYGLYTIVESMDDGFVEANWPGSEGGLWEMCRSCDLNLDCSQYELQETGDNFDESGLLRACDAARSGDAEQIRAHFDWARLTRYMALERVANHADSYSYNLNNHYLYHDPLTDWVTLTPWGADSTFSYSYPPDEERPCEPGYFDNLANDPGAWLATWCRATPECWTDVKAEMSGLAELLVAEDFAGYVDHTRDRIAEAVAEDPTWPWGVDTWTEKSECFHQWISDRPAQVEAFVASH